LTGQLIRQSDVQTPAGKKFFSSSKIEKALWGQTGLPLIDTGGSLSEGKAEEVRG
jgi:hypothetical protein